jgi:uncharacterized damage-inducible protein DinB
MNPIADDVGAAMLAEVHLQLENSRRKILHCVDQLNDEQVWWRAGESFNSIANLMLHLEGNVRQRILSLIGGQPDTRNRDQEFAERGPIPKEELASRLDSTLQEAAALIVGLPLDGLLETRRFKMLQGEVEGTFVKIILHTIVHVGAHTQEIVALTRLQLREAYRFMQ